MNDLIYRSAALNAIDCWHIDFNSMDGAKVQMDCWRTIKELPAVDAVPVIHGRWVYEDSDPMTMPCSNCNYRVFRYNNTPFCPNCGADMREVGVKNENRE